MPYKFETTKKKLSPEHDRRRKLTPEQRREIHALYFQQGEPIREIARRFSLVCSRRTIQFILFPERLQKLQEISKEEKRHLKYYNREKHTKAMKEHRRYKQKRSIEAGGRQFQSKESKSTGSDAANLNS
jgi:transposase-like protein